MGRAELGANESTLLLDTRMSPPSGRDVFFPDFSTLEVSSEKAKKALGELMKDKPKSKEHLVSARDSDPF